MTGHQRPRALPLPSLVTQTNARGTSLPHRHILWRRFLLFLFFLNILLLLFLLFQGQTLQVRLCVCPQSHSSCSSLAFFQSLVLLLQPLQCPPGRRRKERQSQIRHTCIMKLWWFKAQRQQYNSEASLRQMCTSSEPRRCTHPSPVVNLFHQAGLPASALLPQAASHQLSGARPPSPALRSHSPVHEPSQKSDKRWCLLLCSSCKSWV